MPDEQTQDNSTDTQDAGQDQGENLSEDQVDQPDSGEQETKFSKAQMQQLSSMMGSMIKQYGEKHVMPLLENASSAVHPSPGATGALHPAMEKFNEELQDMILSGNVTGALEKYNKIQQQANQTLSTKRQKQLDSAIDAYSDKPYYGEVKDTANQFAAEAMKRGYPPQPAAEFGYTKAVNEMFQKKFSGDIDGGSLHLESGGRRTGGRKKPAKLPPQYEQAYQRDKAKGLFANREEFIESLAPQIRAMLEL